jgi:hypothetical protein
MGSWNDLGFQDADLQRRYEELTRRLYSAVLGAVDAAINEPTGK